MRPSVADVEPDSLAHLSSSKTDEELLTLSADAGSLIPEARDLLASELARRHLTGKHWTRDFGLQSSSGKQSPSHIDANRINLEENPAFNTPAKVAYILVFVFTWGTAVAVLALMIRYDNRWKEEIASIALGMLLV